MGLQLDVLLHARLGTADLALAAPPQQLVGQLHLGQQLVAQLLVIAELAARGGALLRLGRLLHLHLLLKLVDGDQAGAGEVVRGVAGGGAGVLAVMVTTATAARRRKAYIKVRYKYTTYRKGNERERERSN